nr:MULTISPECIES: endolytic transglycosylase MltG [unclassified Streptococcus]
MTAVILLLVLTGIAVCFYLKSSLEPVDARATEMVQLEIPEGSSTKEIAQILEEHQLIKNAMVFNYYSKLKSYNNFKSGFYNLSQSMSVDQLAKALQESGTAVAQEPIAGKVLIIEGYTIKQIAQALTDNVHTSDKEDKTPFTEEAFLETIQNEEFINRMVATYPKLLASLPASNSGVRYRLEGYLFPATYDYSTDTSMEELIEHMIAAMDDRLQPYYDQLAAKGLDVNQLLTVASLVEKEGATDEDRRNIASVFFNRLNIGMPLQSNIAILYAMDKLGEKTTLKEDTTIDTTIDSPYNIYVNTGLMPGPVDSPSYSAIEATFAPNKTNHYYFVADVTTGAVYFATTGEEHNQNVEKYVNSKLNN